MTRSLSVVLLVVLALTGCPSGGGGGGSDGGGGASDGGDGGGGGGGGPPPVWSGAMASTQGYVHLRAALDDSGDALLVWQTAGGASLMAARYTSAGGWGAPVTIATDSLPNEFTDFHLSMNEAGQALVVFEHDATVPSVEAQRYDPASGWLSKPEVIDPDTQTPSAATPAGAMLPDGSTMVAWVAGDGHATTRIRAGGASAWGAPTPHPSSDPTVLAYDVEMAESGPGKPVFLRDTQNGATFIEYDPASGFTSLGPFAGSLDAPEVASGPASTLGYVFTTGGVSSGDPEVDAAVSAAAATAINTPAANVSVSFPTMGLDGRGNGLAMWAASDNGTLGIRVARYTAAGGWAAPKSLDADVLDDGPALAVADTGAAVAAWLSHDDPDGAVWVEHFDPNAGWSQDPTPDAATTAFTAQVVAVAINGQGQSLVAWWELGDSTADHPASLFVKRYP